ncbi:MAG: hypothetical protein GQ581_09210 [Methyloprofundus sp.]|nr:hypothetical protein [Methyloprofundus sp.]
MNKIKEVELITAKVYNNTIGGLVMDTQSILPSSLFPQSFLNDVDLKEHRQKGDGSVEENRQHRLQRLNELASDVYHTDRDDEQKHVGTATTEMGFQSYASRTSHSAEIEVRTQEGDIVTINISELAESSQSEFQARQGNNSLSIYSETSSYSSSFSLSVEGDLNEDELKSINDLVKQMTKVSDKFFDGNTVSAFKHANKIGFNTEQLSGFSMDLNRERSVQAVSAYQQTTVPEQNINTDLIKQAGDFLAQTKEFLADANAMLDFLEQPQEGFDGLFAGIGQMHQEENPVEDKLGQQAFLDMINNISSDVFSEA